MIKKVYYESFDGEEFDTAEECLKHEDSYKKPKGVVLANRQRKILSEVVNEDYECEDIWYVYLPSYENVEWFNRAGNTFGFDTSGIEKEGYYYYDENNYEWVNIEQKRKSIVEKENEIKELLKS